MTKSKFLPALRRRRTTSLLVRAFPPQVSMMSTPWSTAARRAGSWRAAWISVDCGVRTPAVRWSAAGTRAGEPRKHHVGKPAA
eukprot:6690563-Pyramimonas_sp.AAC.1